MRTVILRRHIGSMIFTAFCLAVTVVALGSLTAILWSLLSNGLPALNMNVFTMSTPAPGLEGGLLNAIVGSVMMSAIAMLIAVVIGVLAGTWLAEFATDGAYGRLVRYVNDILLSAPSIIIGIFIWGLLVAPFRGYSGFAGAVALAMIAIPIITRATEDVLRLQPASLREASVGLGAPMWVTVMQVLWRASRAGMLTGILLAFARISGETAPLLFTALSNQFFSLDLTQPTASLPMAIYNFALSATDSLRELAWAGSLIIAAAVLVIGLAARLVSREQTR